MVVVDKAAPLSSNKLVLPQLTMVEMGEDVSGRQTNPSSDVAGDARVEEYTLLLEARR